MAPNITMQTDDLLAHRPATIGRMLTPLKDSVVACQLHHRTVRRRKVIAAHGGGTRPESDFQSWRFRTVAREIECQYYELWSFGTDHRIAFLDRARLHLYRTNYAERTSDQLICIHADPYAEPEREEDEAVVPYRQGVHLHVSRSEHPLPKCHFPLVLSHLDKHLDDVLSSVRNLTTVIQNAVQAVRLEVLSRFK